MKRKQFLLVLLLVSLFSIFFVSCNLLWPDMSKQDRWIRGREIDSYPRWLRHTDFEVFADSPAYGVSEWTDWQSDQAKQFHALVPDDVMSHEFTGKFRLILLGQDTSIVFNDKDRTGYSMFFHWVHKMNSTTLTMKIPQEDEKRKYEYNCHIKTNLRESETDSNKGKVILTRLSSAGETVNRFNYKLIRQGKTIIDIDLKNSFEVGIADIESNNLTWFPVRVSHLSKQKDFTNNTVDEYYEKVEIGTTLWFSMQLDKSNIRKGGLYCFEGITLKEVDDTNKRISFWLEDRANSGFADYVTLKMHNDLQYADISYYKDGVAEPISTDTDVQCFYE